jgi:septum formation protein
VPQLILASRSPQRCAILEQLGVDFEVRIPDAEEVVQGDPEAVAVENARRKAAAVVPDGRVPVLGVDTVVCLGPRIYDKPQGPDEARATLRALSGRAHTVISGVCLIEAGQAITGASCTRVEFRELEESVLGWYVATGEWRERAGGYAIQGRGAALVSRVEGDYLGVVGLPVALLLNLAPWLLKTSGG